MNATIETKILEAHGKALPQNWVYTDSETTIDLLVAEILTLRRDLKYESDNRLQDAKDNSHNFIEWRDREHYPLKVKISNLTDALRDALDIVEFADEEFGKQGLHDAAKVCKEVIGFARRLGVRRNCPGKDVTCPCRDGDACHYEGPNAWPLK